jgi:hypothetical protein
MENALAYFTSSKPTRQMEEALKTNVQALSQSVCRLIARYVLYLDLTESRRRWRLSTMGLNPRDHSPAFSLDQWVASILAIIVLFMFMSVLIPGRLPFSWSFMYSVRPVRPVRASSVQAPIRASTGLFVLISHDNWCAGLP